MLLSPPMEIVTATTSDAPSTPSPEHMGPLPCPSPSMTLGIRRRLISRRNPASSSTTFVVARDAGDDQNCEPDIPHTMSPQRRSKGRQNRASLPTVLTLEPRLSSDLVPRDDPSQITPWWSTQAHGPNKTEVNRAIQGAIYIGYAIR